MSNPRFLVNSSPHYRSKDSTTTIMLDVIIALLPLLGAATIYFGFRALTISLVSVGSCIAFESLFNWITKQKNTVGDLSAVVTGLLLGLNLPVVTPYWMVTVGGFFAIVVVKCLFGGLGKNFLNPALAARAFLFCWPTIMTTFTKPFADVYYTASFVFGEPMFTDGTVSDTVDAISGATTLSGLKEGIAPDEGLWDMFVGNMAGCLGETCTLLILVGFIYLLCRKVITWHIPVCYIGTVALLTYLFPVGGMDNLSYMGYELLSGGLMLGAVFMATDYATSPLSKTGKIIYAVGCGGLTVLLRTFGGYPESVSYSILIMNVVTLALDRYLKPRRYGIGGENV
ncbi:MAG: RnfABCDGE type electron transport complex subunit D [Clostridia bacterium]|nr:RnfABCDGE type electron transport complex subunit D [Clostridia bacterium]